MIARAFLIQGKTDHLVRAKVLGNIGFNIDTFLCSKQQSGEFFELTLEELGKDWNFCNWE